MSSKLPPVPHRAPLSELNGIPTQAWADWFQKLFLRVGGTVADTNDELYIITADRIPAKSISFSKIQDIGTDKLIGRDTAGTGDFEELTVTGGLEFTGSGEIRTTALTGDVTKTAGGTVTTLANNVVSFIKLLSTDWSNSKATSGYQKLASGVYLQWGVTGSLSSATSTTVSFPVAFPTACAQVIPGVQDNSAVAITTTGQYGTGNYGTGAFDLYNRTSVALTFNWIAVGY